MNERKDYELGKILKNIWSIGSNIAAILCSMVVIQIFDKSDI